MYLVVNKNIDELDIADKDNIYIALGNHHHIGHTIINSHISKLFVRVHLLLRKNEIIILYTII